MTLRIHGTVEQIRARLPAGVATLEGAEAEAKAGHEAGAEGGAARGAEAGDAGGGDAAGERWLRVGLRAERLDWLPPVLAALDRPFVVERPTELRALVTAFADRLAARARQV